MPIAQIENLIRYVTNSEVKATDVLVPLELWKQLIHSFLGRRYSINLLRENCTTLQTLIMHFKFCF
jgi:hypothetical protein